MADNENRELTVKTQPSMLVLSEEVVDNYMQTSKMLTTKFKEWLIPEVEFTTKIFGKGRKPTLLDPGAGKLIGFFSCRPRHRVLERFYDKDEEGYESIRYVIATEIVQESTGKVVAEGVGSCTSDEVKYKYRWYFSSELKKMGMSEDEIHALPEREINTSRGKAKQYRARNPEIPDLDNTILKMAAKRAEVDATLQLPGVAAVFTQDVGDYKTPDVQPTEKRKPVDSTQKTVGIPSFRKANGEAVDTVSVELLENYLAEEGLDVSQLDMTDAGVEFRITPAKYLETEWGPINDLVRKLGGRWMKVDGEKNYWSLPKQGFDEKEPESAAPTEYKSIEAIEYLLDSKFAGARDMFAVTEDADDFTVEPMKALETEIVEEVTALLEPIGGVYREVPGQIGYTWLIKKG